MVKGMAFLVILPSVYILLLGKFGHFFVPWCPHP